MSNPAICPRCNAVNVAGARFCSLCASPMVEPPSATPAAKSREASEAFVLCLAIFGLVGCGPISAIPALILARRQRAANPQAQLPVASYWISIIALGVSALTVLSMIAIFSLNAKFQ